MKKTALLFAVLSGAAVASTVVARSLEDRVRLADRVVLAQVVAQQVENIGTREKPKLVTHNHLLIGEDFKGSGPMELDLVQVGGKWGLWEQHISDDAHFVIGETAVMLLTCPAQLHACRLSGLADAKLAVEGDHVVVRDMFDGTWSRPKLAQLRAQLSQVRGVPEVITTRGAR